MKMKILRWGLVFSVLSQAVWAQVVSADELSDLKARNAQLETTVQELTLQLAEALKRQDQLEAALAQSRSAIPPAAETSSVATAASDREVLIEEAIEAPGQVQRASPDTMVSADDNACNVSQALAAYSGSGDDNRALSAWLEDTDRLGACSDEQLLRLRDAVKWDWLGYQKAVLGRIDEELESR